MLSAEFRGRLSADSPYRTDILTAHDILAEQASAKFLDAGLTPEFITTSVDGLNGSPTGNAPVQNPLAANARGGTKSRMYPYGINLIHASHRNDAETTPPALNQNNGIMVMSPFAVTPEDAAVPVTRTSPNIILPGETVDPNAALANTPNIASYATFDTTGFLAWAIIAVVAYFIFKGVLA